MDKQTALFIIVSTGQNLANLPPLLEMAKKNDEVLWIESAASRNGNWSEGARRVISDHGLVSRPEQVEIANLNNPTEIIACLHPIIHAISKNKRILFIANGGPKLTPLGVLQACSGLNVEILYGETNPVGYYLLPSQLENNPGVLEYKNHRLDLIDILHSYNYLFSPSDPKPLQLWPNPTQTTDLSDIYGLNEKETIRLHDHLYGITLAHIGNNDKKSPRFADLEKVVQAGRLNDPATGWKNQIVSSLLALKYSLHYTTHQANILKNEKFLTQLPIIYNSTVSLSDKLRSAIIQMNADNTGNLANRDIGKRFENGVGFRVVNWIAHNQQSHQAIQSVWQNVSVCRKADESIKVAEWDVLIVLKNGILLNIECKSFTTTPLKELDARLLNLKEMGSEAKMIVCFPFYTRYVDRPWFNISHIFKNKLKKMPYLPFTFPGQPESYVVQLGETTVEDSCPSFEDQLGRILKPYCLG